MAELASDTLAPITEFERMSECGTLGDMHCEP
jgi:hypothetical protein